jgi:hypothetical protein
VRRFPTFLKKQLVREAPELQFAINGNGHGQMKGLPASPLKVFISIEWAVLGQESGKE